MPNRQIDPARLEGDELRRWYLRTPEEVERERQATADQHYRAYFRSPIRPPSAEQGDLPIDTQSEASDQSRRTELVWTPVGKSRWRADRPTVRLAQLGTPSDEPEFGDAVLDYGLAGPAAGGEFIEIGSKTRKQRRDWERREGKPWPTTEEGQNYHVHHKEAKAYGGSEDLDNLEPKHPRKHIQDHVDNGDFKEWGSWSRKGKKGVAPPPKTSKAGPKIRSFGPFGILSNITGILSGRIRTDSLDNFSSDMLGLPSQEDYWRSLEDRERKRNPNWKPGDPMVGEIV